MKTKFSLITICFLSLQLFLTGCGGSSCKGPEVTMAQLNGNWVITKGWSMREEGKHYMFIGPVAKYMYSDIGSVNYDASITGCTLKLVRTDNQFEEDFCLSLSGDELTMTQTNTEDDTKAHSVVLKKEG